MSNIAKNLHAQKATVSKKFLKVLKKYFFLNLSDC